MFLAFYHFVWRTRDEEEGGLRVPAAMAAAVVNTRWSFEDLFDAVMTENYANSGLTQIRHRGKWKPVGTTAGFFLRR